MHHRPEETAGAKSEDDRETEQPGKGKLFRLNISADDGQNQSNQADRAEDNGKTGKTPALEIFSFRLRQGFGTLAHLASKRLC